MVNSTAMTLGSGLRWECQRRYCKRCGGGNRGRRRGVLQRVQRAQVLLRFPGGGVDLKGVVHGLVFQPGELPGQSCEALPFVAAILLWERVLPPQVRLCGAVAAWVAPTVSSRFWRALRPIPYAVRFMENVSP